jgi:hypothetical protein
VVGKAGQSIDMNGRFLCLHGMRSGNYTIALPGGCHRVRDAVTGVELASGVDSYILAVESQHTYWLVFE